MFCFLSVYVILLCSSTCVINGQCTTSNCNNLFSDSKEIRSMMENLGDFVEKFQLMYEDFSSGLQLMKGNSEVPSRETCLRIKRANPNAPSGMYTIYFGSLKRTQVYCEMGLNGGGYTFLSPESLVDLTNFEVVSMFTDRTNFLLRVQKTDGTQPYAVLKQLPQYSNISLKLGLNNYEEYNPPVNLNTSKIDPPFLYFGFLPIQYATNKNVQGLRVNGVSNTFTNCDRKPNSHFTLYPNFPERQPSTYNEQYPFCDKLFSLLAPNPSGRVMPSELFMFGETHWGGCGCYKQSNEIPNILSFSIGFR